jgi:hypothetical protein
MRNLLIALATVLTLLGGAPAAHASGRDVINDCTDDEVLSKTYTQQDYRDALAKLPADADQYGDCRDIIARAQEAAATKGGSKRRGGTTGAGSGSGGPTPPSSQPAQQQLAAASPADRAAAADAARNGAGAAPVAGRRVDTSDVGVAPRSSGVSDLPLPVLLLLALLLAGALALAAVRVRSLVHARRA